jgi:hypothetical protein
MRRRSRPVEISHRKLVVSGPEEKRRREECRKNDTGNPGMRWEGK